MGPILMLDKSTFQALGYQEHSLLNRLFKLVLPPVLAHEVIADLIKKPQKGPSARGSDEGVRLLASKFLGSGPTVCVDYRAAALGALQGNRVAMTGQIPVLHWNRQDLPDGGYGVMIDLHPLNHAIMRWSEGSFLELETAFAETWKKTNVEVHPERFRRRLYEARIISRRIESLCQLRAAVNTVFENPSYQEVWLQWLLDELSPPAQIRATILARWNFLGRPPLADFGLYAAHCVRSMLALDIAVQSRLLSWHKHHRIDLQYLFYLPFCMVFVSNERLHKAIAPALLRANQSFIAGETIKSELAALNAHSSWHEHERSLPELCPTLAALRHEHLRGDKRIIAEDSLT